MEVDGARVESWLFDQRSFGSHARFRDRDLATHPFAATASLPAVKPNIRKRTSLAVVLPARQPVANPVAPLPAQQLDPTQPQPALSPTDSWKVALDDLAQEMSAWQVSRDFLQRRRSVDKFRLASLQVPAFVRPTRAQNGVPETGPAAA